MIVSLFIVITIAGGATIAYITSVTPEIDNSFLPVYVDCRVVEEFTGTVKSNVSVENTGDIKAYVRAVFVVMWMADDGSVYGIPPTEGLDYNVVFGSDLWVLGSDGFYYYTLPVDPGVTTAAMIDSLTILANPPEGHKLNVHVAATAIQAEPGDVVGDAWGATVDSNGRLTAP